MAKKKRRSNGTGTLFQRVEGGPWIIAWFDHNGKRREGSTRTTDRKAAERILGKRVADAALRREGVVDARADRYATAGRRQLSAHIGDWKTALAAKGVTSKHKALVVTRAETLLKMAKAECQDEMSASAVRTPISELRTEGKRTE